MRSSDSMVAGPGVCGFRRVTDVVILKAARLDAVRPDVASLEAECVAAACVAAACVGPDVASLAAASNAAVVWAVGVDRSKSCEPKSRDEDGFVPIDPIDPTTRGCSCINF